MDIDVVIFLIFSIITIISAIMVLFCKEIVHSVIFLVLLFAMVGCIYIFLEAEYIALIQILIYAGAITVLVLFAVMLTRRVIIEKEMKKEKEKEKPKYETKIVVVAFLLYILVIVFVQAPWDEKQIVSKPIIEIGEKMFKDYILPFSIIALILFCAIIGGVILAREEKEVKEKQE